MFENEICRNYNDLRIVWYPKEEICLVFYGKLMRTYNKIPKKYMALFEK